jgi:hypothetical protein
MIRAGVPEVARDQRGGKVRSDYREIPLAT